MRNQVLIVRRGIVKNVEGDKKIKESGGSGGKMEEKGKGKICPHSSGRIDTRV